MSESTRKHRLKYTVDMLIILIMCGLLYYAASWQIFEFYTDAARYQCYAEAFWHGVAALNQLPSSQCDFIFHPDKPHISPTALAQTLQKRGLPVIMVRYVASQPSTDRFHALPYEYPLLTLIPFTLGLLADPHWYQVAFAFWMLLIAAMMYLLLVSFRSRKAAIVCAFYLIVGSWATAAGRFDLIPATLTLGALLYAVRAKWKWGFALLAVATMFKFYPLILLVPFLLAQQVQSRATWYAWRRWLPLAVFSAVCAVVMVASLLLNVEGTLAPLSYFGDRPIQVESLSASLIWLVSSFKHDPANFAFTFGSLNIISPLSSGISLIGTGLLIVGLLYTYWLQWQAKIDLAVSCLLTLLIVMVTGKIFSPQYLIWVTPFVAYVGEYSLWWIVPWGMIGLLTTWIYPYIYQMSDLLKVPYLPLFFPVTTIRNLLLLAFVLALLWHCSRKPSIRSVRATNQVLKTVTVRA